MFRLVDTLHVVDITADEAFLSKAKSLVREVAEEHIGQPNTPETREKMIDAIIEMPFLNSLVKARRKMQGRR